MEKKEKHTLEFYGTNYLSLAPLIAFVFFCILFFVIYKDFEMEAICMGGFVSLIVGSLLAKKKGDYWNAVVKGMSSEMMNTLALILLVVGIFGKMMTRAGVAEGFVWIGEQMGLKGGFRSIFFHCNLPAFYFYRYIHRNIVYGISYFISLRYSAWS